MERALEFKKRQEVLFGAWADLFARDKCITSEIAYVDVAFIWKRCGKEVMESANEAIARVFEMNAMKNLFPPVTDNQASSTSNYLNSPSEHVVMAGYYAAELSMSILAESIRSPDTLPSTLK